VAAAYGDDMVVVVDGDGIEDVILVVLNDYTGVVEEETDVHVEDDSKEDDAREGEEEEHFDDEQEIP